MTALVKFVLTWPVLAFVILYVVILVTDALVRDFSAKGGKE